ncbi:transmembrane protein, putative (macronuclear) [Tetrahymena thermophila SB210]|uniref:Transmembrane protein, putative n=1 Tax=Tetrahymena thermophila (strain SB210) TaxID=312017 RepID=W7XIQ6_TETTS|nr:transmembrane protein, putative [Tetrahymena thermophila SB210]EWS74821.1 transmembrane protein, putative [Tetrahymena thermophila SB210]|eukprot:XP_012652652.1 transmembrane protein, putative [Tetrahymena thermophila SB210]
MKMVFRQYFNQKVSKIQKQQELNNLTIMKYYFFFVFYIIQQYKVVFFNFYYDFLSEFYNCINSHLRIVFLNVYEVVLFAMKRFIDCFILLQRIKTCFFNAPYYLQQSKTSKKIDSKSASSKAQNQRVKSLIYMFFLIYIKWREFLCVVFA